MIMRGHARPQNQKKDSVSGADPRWRNRCGLNGERVAFRLKKMDQDGGNKVFLNQDLF